MGVLDILTKSSESLDNCFTMADMEKPDQPAIYVNQKFEDLTGYSRDEILGRNFRFLQGPMTAKPATENIRAAIGKRWAFHVDIVNYKKDGQPFWDRMVLLPLEHEKHLYYMGMQLDVTTRLRAEVGQTLEITTPTAARHQEICHIFRNRLNVITLIQEMINKPLAPERLREHQEKLRRAVKQLAEYLVNLPWDQGAPDTVLARRDVDASPPL